MQKRWNEVEWWAKKKGKSSSFITCYVVRVLPVVKLSRVLPIYNTTMVSHSGRRTLTSYNALVARVSSIKPACNKVLHKFIWIFHYQMHCLYFIVFFFEKFSVCSSVCYLLMFLLKKRMSIVNLTQLLLFLGVKQHFMLHMLRFNEVLYGLGLKIVLYEWWDRGFWNTSIISMFLGNNRMFFIDVFNYRLIDTFYPNIDAL